MAEEKDTKRETTYILPPKYMQGAEFAINQWAIEVENGISLSRVMQPAFWAHVASKLRPWDKIFVRPHEGHWYAELLVTEASRNWAKVHLLKDWALTTNDVAQTLVSMQEHLAAGMKELEVKFRASHQWCVLRRADGSILVENLTSREGAHAWVIEHMRGLAPA
jgi:hypothetical protein